MAEVKGMKGMTDSTRLEESRRVALEDRLRHRDNERLEALEVKRQAREETSAEHENVAFFGRKFGASADAITADITDAQAGKVETSRLGAHFEAVNDAVQNLNKYLAESKLFLPTYDLRKSQEKIDSLQEALSTARNTLMPRKKFGFKNKSKAKVSTVTADAVTTTTTTTTTDDAKKIAERDEGDYVVKDRTKDRLCISENLDQRVVGLFRLEDCDLLLRGSPSAMHLRDLRRCRVFVGPVSGSIFLDRCQDCVFVLACQQLRIHTTYDTSFYIHVTSKAIIEDCSRVAFSPYNLDYPSLEADYVTSGLDRSRNNWQSVDDFNFLSTEAASPNWRILSDNERRISWTHDIKSLTKLSVNQMSLSNSDGGGDVGS